MNTPGTGCCRVPRKRVAGTQHVWSPLPSLALGVVIGVSGGCAGNPSTTTSDSGNSGAPTSSSGAAQDTGSGAAGTSGSSDSGSGSTSESGIQQGPPATIGDAQAELDTSGIVGSVDASAASTDAAGSNKILIYGVTTPGTYRHAAIGTAATALAQAAMAVGLTSEIYGTTDATNVADPAKFTAAALAKDGAVILISNDGEPFGYPATQEIQNLIDYVQNGGALLILHCTPDCYGGAASGPILGHPASLPFHVLIGSTWLGHPGNVAPATCITMGTHPSVAGLAPTFNLTDEIYTYSYLGPDIHVVMTCTSSTDPKTVRVSSFYREQGQGRIFTASLGHPDISWTMPMDPKLPNSRLVQDHVIPALLWAMRR